MTTQEFYKAIGRPNFTDLSLSRQVRRLRKFSGEGPLGKQAAAELIKISPLCKYLPCGHKIDLSFGKEDRAFCDKTCASRFNSELCRGVAKAKPQSTKAGKGRILIYL